MPANFSFSSHILLRTPAFSFKDFEARISSLNPASSEVQLAIYLANPVFYSLIESKSFKPALLSPKERLTLHKFYNRMSFRPTPFGLFAGFSSCVWGNDGPVIVSRPAASKVHLQLDQQLEVMLSQRVLQKLSPQTRLLRNPGLYKVGRTFRFIRTAKNETDNSIVFSIDSIAASRPLQMVLDSCEKGVTSAFLVAQLMQATGCTKQEALDYIFFLQHAGILLKDLDPNITGPSYLTTVLQRTRHTSDPFLKDVKRLNDKLKETKRWSVEELGNLAEKTVKYAGENSGEGLKTPFYTNYERPVLSGCVPDRYRKQILAALEVLEKLAPPTGSAHLNTFISRFQERFDKQKIPLLTALDPETGIGYGEAEETEPPALLKDLGFAIAAPDNIATNWTPLHKSLITKWITGENARPGQEIFLTKADLDELGIKEPGVLPPSFSILFRILNGKIFIETAGGVTGTALPGRFTSFSNEVHTTATQIAKQEQDMNPGVIFADIVLLSSHHTDNINRRQHVYDHEIVINAASRLPPEQQIPLHSLLVSVEGNKVVLESAALKKIVIPRLSSAYNYTRSDLAAFRFLCDLQGQGLQSNLTLSLEAFFPGLPYYPRVETDEAVLYLARWNLSKTDIALFTGPDRGESIKAFRAFCRQKQVPRRIALTRHDQQLVVDVSSDEQVNFLLDCLQGEPGAQLQEFPFLNQDEYPVLNSDGQPLISQFMSFLVKDVQTYATNALRSGTIKKTREYMPGSEWLFLKLYCHPSVANRLLVKQLLPVIQSLGTNPPTEWFFIRYMDPAPHLRIRLKIKREKTGSTLSLFEKKLKRLVQQNSIKDYRVDVYRRELERYNDSIIEYVERVFCASSVVVSGFIKKMVNAPFKHSDHDFALFTSNRIATLFFPDATIRLLFLERMFELYYQEFATGKSLRVDLDQKFRAMRAVVTSVLDDKMVKDDAAMHFERTIIELLKHAPAATEPGFINLAGDMIHMHVNRVFPTLQRQQELVIYYFLLKYTKSALARNTSSRKSLITDPV